MASLARLFPMTPALFVLDARAFELIYGAPGAGEIKRRARVLGEPLTRETVKAHPELSREAEVIFSGWGAPVMDEAFLAAAPRLRAVFYGAGSVRYFATDALWERGVVVASAGAINAIPVSEYTLAAILFSLKHGSGAARVTVANPCRARTGARWDWSRSA